MPKAKTSQTHSKPLKTRSSELDRLRRRLEEAEERDRMTGVEPTPDELAFIANHAQDRCKQSGLKAT